MQTSCSVQKEKCPVDKLKIQHSVRILSEHENKKEDNETSDLQNIERNEGKLVSTTSLAPNINCNEEAWK